ncbi:MAG: HD domain-containing protein [Candidatus Paceibacterota bacterium]
MTLVAKAIEFAKIAHGDQKYGDKPYFQHLLEVGMAVTLSKMHYKHVGDDEVICAAFLHDVLEDTEVTRKQLIEEFGVKVADLVFAVTDEPGISRKEKKAKTLLKIAGAGDAATLIKLCDRICNMRNSAGTSFMDMYKKEAAEFKRVLYRKGLFEELWSEFDALVKS